MSVDVDSNRQTIEAVVDGYLDSFNASSVDDLVRLFTPDGIVMADEMPSVSGRDQIRETFAGAFSAMRFSFEHAVDDVIVEGNIAVVRAHAAGTATVLAANTTIPMPDHRELFVLRRANAEWRISEYMFNTTVSKGRS